jgi:DNA invertase Pin-like site-specific DNA recombinase
MDEKQTRVGIYARISEDRDGQQTATARQMADARAFAERKGWGVVEIFEDIDLSAFQLKTKRPEFERMLKALREGEVEGIVVWKFDRLTRQQRDLARVMEACEPHKAFVASVTEPIDTRETYGQFVAELLVAQARMESANTSARQRRKAQEQREQGLPPTNGRRCFGYDRRYTTVVTEEAAIVREVRDRLFAGESLRSVCLNLEVRGVVATSGNAWRPQILKRLLVSPTIAGQREKDGTRYPGTWPAIISPEESERLRLLLTRREGAGRKSPARRYLLTGYVRCGRCQGRMHAHARPDGARRYVCMKAPGYPNCGSMSVTADALEELVKELLIVAVDDAALGEALRTRDEQDDRLTETVRRDEERLEELSRDFYVDRLISKEEFLASRRELAARLEGNRARLAKRSGAGLLGRFLGEGETLRAAWDTGSLEWRRSIVGALLESIVIQPGSAGRRALDPRRVQPVWRY